MAMSAMLVADALQADALVGGLLQVDLVVELFDGDRRRTDVLERCRASAAQRRPSSVSA